MLDYLLESFDRRVSEILKILPQRAIEAIMTVELDPVLSKDRSGNGGAEYYKVRSHDGHGNWRSHYVGQLDEDQAIAMKSFLSFFSSRAKMLAMAGVGRPSGKKFAELSQ